MSATNKKSEKKSNLESEHASPDSLDAAVFFIDILGMDALTNGNVTLKPEDYEAWRITSKEKRNHHYLAARLLYKFRRVLFEVMKSDALRNLPSDIQYAQLSDGAFIWSEDIASLLVVATIIMKFAIGNGLLCRAGLSYGNVLLYKEEDKEYVEKLGRFIVGEAVTNAVRNERSGKGARVFCDKKTYKKLQNEFKDGIIKSKNPLNGTAVYEYKWYHPSTKVLPSKANIKQLKDDPKLRWNRSTPEGRAQIDGTIAALEDAIAKIKKATRTAPTE